MPTPTLTSVFTSIANAIRSKNGSAATYTPTQMPQAILAISSGSEATITEPMIVNTIIRPLLVPRVVLLYLIQRQVVEVLYSQ